jgi:putative tricarboxylic transport membrane protein
MIKADRWIGLLLALLSLYVCWESVRLGLGTYHRPGSGFFSFYAGIVLGALSLVLLCLALFRDLKEGEAWGSWRRILLVAIAMFGFTLLLERLGFLIITFLFVWFLLKVVERRGWAFSLGVAVLVAGASYAVFDLWLKAQLPAGLLGN